MKKNLTIYIAILAITFSLATVNYAQLGGLINKAKDAIDKKKDKNKKEETKPNEATKPVESTNNSSPTPTPNGSAKPVENELGTIYFSNKPFPAGGGVEGAKNSFNSKEFIYGRLVLKSGTVKEVLKNLFVDETTPKAYFKLYLRWFSSNNSYSTSEETIPLKEFGLDKTYLDFDLLPSPTQATTVTVEGKPITFMNSHIYYSNTSHEGVSKFTIKVEFPAKDFRGELSQAKTISIETKEISFDFDGSDTPTMKANLEKLVTDFSNRLEQEEIANRELPQEWKLPSNRLLPIITEAKLRSLVINHFRTEDIPSLKILKIYAFEPRTTNWVIVHNNLGIPTHRVLGQDYTIFFKNTSVNQCFYASNIDIRQDYSGAGTYNQSYANWTSQKFFSCDKLGLK